MDSNSLFAVIAFIVGLAIGLFQLYFAQRHFESEQVKRMDEIRISVDEIRRKLSVIEANTSDRVYKFQDDLLNLVDRGLLGNTRKSLSKTLKILRETSLELLESKGDIEIQKGEQKSILDILYLTEEEIAEKFKITLEHAEFLKSFIYSSFGESSRLELYEKLGLEGGTERKKSTSRPQQ